MNYKLSYRSATYPVEDLHLPSDLKLATQSVGE